MIVHHVYPGESGSSILAGKTNGRWTYMMDIKEHMSSYHIIDGEKVSIRYQTQKKTWRKCHQVEENCPGKAISRDCTAELVKLSDFLK